MRPVLEKACRINLLRIFTDVDEDWDGSNKEAVNARLHQCPSKCLVPGQGIPA